MKRFACVSLFSVCLSFSLSAQSLNQQGLSRLAGWWKLDDATNATVLADSSGNGRDATKGSGVSIVEGLFGKAAYFDGTGNAWARFANPELTNLTIAAWVYMDGIPNNSLPRIMQIGSSTYFLMPSNTLGQFSLGVQNNNWNTNVQDPFKFKTNGWFHAAVVHRMQYTNDTAAVVWPTFYINGVRCGDPLARKAFLTAVPAGTSAFFGNNSAGVGSGVRPLTGMLDDVRLYDAALSDKEILEIYQNSPLAINAGNDQACYSEKTLLQGRLINTNPFMRDLSASINWSAVSAPEGAVPLLATPQTRSTDVTLPLAGTYVFRMTVSNELGTASDDVAVTRSTDAAPGGNAAPSVTPLWSATNAVLGTGAPLSATVTDDGTPGASRLCWSKVSGPGVVFFDDAFTSNTTAFFSTNGTYVVQLLADDGALQSSAQVTVTVALPSGDLSDGLAYWWRMDDDPVLKKAFDSAGTNTLTLLNSAFLQPGKTGYGLRAPKPDASAQGASTLTNAEVMTFTAWFYHDNAYTNNPYMRLFNCGPNFYIIYDRVNNQISLSTTDSNTVQRTWVFTDAKLATNRWFHIAVLFDRQAAASGSKQIMYLNGERYLSTSINPAGTFPGAAAFTSPFTIGNTSPTGGTRNFDGVLDEMRVYSRFLTDEEIRLLATDPDNNHAPVIEGIPDTLTAKVGQPATFQGTVTDDGQPFGSMLATVWNVRSGTPEHVLFADPSDPATEVTFTRTGDYAIMLSATDGEQQAAVLVQVSVVPTGTVLTVQ